MGAKWLKRVWRRKHCRRKTGRRIRAADYLGPVNEAVPSNSIVSQQEGSRQRRKRMGETRKREKMGTGEEEEKEEEEERAALELVDVATSF